MRDTSFFVRSMLVFGLWSPRLAPISPAWMGDPACTAQVQEIPPEPFESCIPITFAENKRGANNPSLPSEAIFLLQNNCPQNRLPIFTAENYLVTERWVT